MKIFLSVLFLLIFGLFVLLATVDLEPYVTSKKEPASEQSPGKTPPVIDLSPQGDEATQPGKEPPSSITTHQLIVTSDSLEATKNEETGTPGPADTAPQTTADPVVDNTLSAPPQNDRP